jgi:hypothetical protein
MTHHELNDDQNGAYYREDRAVEPHGSAVPQPEESVRRRARPKVVARLPDLEAASSGIAPTAAGTKDEQPRNRRLAMVLTGGSAMLLVVALIALPFGKQRLFNARGPHWEANSPAPSAPVAPRWGGAAEGSSGSAAGGGQVNRGPTTVPVTASISSLPVAPLPGATTSASRDSGSAAVPNSSANPAAPSITLPDPTQGWSVPSSAPIPSIPSPPGSPQSSATPTGRSDPTMAAVAPLRYPSYPKTPYADGFEQMNSGPGYAGSSDRPAAVAASRSTVSSAPMVEPGVARLEGTIEKQTQRPTYDLPRPSLY